VAAKKKVKRKKRQMTVSLAVVAGFMPGTLNVTSRWPRAKDMAIEASRIFTGVDPFSGKFNLAWMRSGLLPVALGFGISMVATRLGFNRILSRAGVPFLRI